MDPPPYPGTPRWVRLSAIVAGTLLLLVLVIAVLSGGRHGPGRHLPSDDGSAAPAKATEEGARRGGGS